MSAEAKRSSRRVSDSEMTKAMKTKRSSTENVPEVEGRKGGKECQVRNWHKLTFMEPLIAWCVLEAYGTMWKSFKI